MNFLPISALLLFPVMIVLLDLGRRVRRYHQVEASSSAIEGAVFALFGLLLAFTFSGAMTRYDLHRNLIVEETNAINTAYLQIDLLPAAAQPGLHHLFRDYTTSRMRLYDTTAPERSAESAQLQLQIWKLAVESAHRPGASPDAPKLLLPAINRMIEITFTRENAFRMHPPAIVYLLLFVLSCCCAFVAGYGLSATKMNWLYMIAFAFAVTLTIYTTVEIELPRRGFIRLSHPDRTLVDLRDSMK